MMHGNGSNQIFRTPEGQVVSSDVWQSGQPNNGGQPTFLNESDETASVMRGDGNVYDIRETGGTANVKNYNCSVVCQTSSPTGSVSLHKIITSIHMNT